MGRGGSSKVISNPFAGIAPIPLSVPADPLSGLMAMEAEEIGAAADGRIGVEQVCGEPKFLGFLTPPPPRPPVLNDP